MSLGTTALYIPCTMTDSSSGRTTPIPADAPPSVQATSSARRQIRAQQKQRIAQLEKHRAHLERRGKDKQEELKGKGRFVEEIQDEMVALNLQLNMAEQESARLRKENEELTRRWVSKMEEEAARMNREMGWEEQGGA